MDEAAFDAQAFQDRTGVSRETLDRFSHWLALLEQTNTHTNLVGRSTLSGFWFRHAYDSWQLLDLAPGAARWADLGAGAGFPGLALVFGLMERRVEGAHVTLIESIAKKAAFLKRVIRETGAPATVHCRSRGTD
jgi:16S rRNA (guanine527-N7)-methyltransferase